VSAPLPIALTSGESAGIGPDLCLAIAQRARDYDLVCLGDRDLLRERARLLGWRCALPDYERGVPPARAAGELSVLHEPLSCAAVPGRLEPRNAPAVLRIIERAAQGCLAGEFAAVCTAPVQKSVINDAGLAFSGHTEYLAELCHAPRPVMLLVAGTLRVALATTHLPLRAVPASISTEGLIATLRVLDAGLRLQFGIERPRIGACGLNPHAGEHGHLGDEEIRIIGPALAQARALGIGVDGPHPADTLFLPRRLEGYDAVLAMYHDQGLPVLKHAGFGAAVNVTLGLPIIRTSVDHGTALDLAGSGRADAGSLRAALELAFGLGERARLATVAAGAHARP
jgi:4-hydroxythreonine-4-phosphate dehydrogenase